MPLAMALTGDAPIGPGAVAPGVYMPCGGVATIDGLYPDSNVWPTPHGVFGPDEGGGADSIAMSRACDIICCDCCDESG